MRPYCGVDIIHTSSEDHKKREGNIESNWEIWETKTMVLMDSSYHACQAVLLSRKIMLGDRKVKYNPFHWYKFVLNLTEDSWYKPHQPCVSKRREEWCVTVDIFAYVDDVIPTGPSEEDYFQASRRCGLVCTHLGIQDASRKRQPPSPTTRTLDRHLDSHRESCAGQGVSVKPQKH